MKVRVRAAVALALLLAVLLAGCASAPSSDVMRGVVTRVVDGDTIHVALDDGTAEKVRLIGLDTPEDTKEHEPFGPEATAYTREALDGAVVYLETDAELRDRYGRLLAYVWTEMPSTRDDAETRSRMFNAMLLLDGYAAVSTYPPNVRYEPRFRDYAAEAREAGRVLWGQRQRAVSVYDRGSALSGVSGRTRMVVAGTPPTTVRGGTFLLTTAPADTTAPSPTVTPGSIVELAPGDGSGVSFTQSPVPRECTSTRPF